MGWEWIRYHDKYFYAPSRQTLRRRSHHHHHNHHNHHHHHHHSSFHFPAGQGHAHLIRAQWRRSRAVRLVQADRRWSIARVNPHIAKPNINIPAIWVEQQCQ